MPFVLKLTFPFQGMPLSYCSYLSSREYLCLISTHASDRYTLRVLDCLHSFKPLGKKPISLLFIFSQLISINLLRYLGSTGGNQLSTLRKVSPVLPIQLYFSLWDEWPLSLSLCRSSEPRWLILCFFSWIN